MRNDMRRIAFRISVLIIAFVILGAHVHAQDDRGAINKSLVPAEGSDVGAFVPKGWKIEEQLKDDLNADSIPDYVLKLIENKAGKDKDDYPMERARALVIVFGRADGKFIRAAVADKLLQCTTCGGAFYGVVEAPANVTIEKGVIVVEQDHGSRWVTDMTFRFRYDAPSGKLLLIGFDFTNNDRAEGNAVSESTNYLTGARIT